MLGRKKKVDEDKLMKWVNKSLEEGSDLEQIKAVLTRKYPKKFVDEFIKKNYEIEPKDDLDAEMEKEKKKKEEEEELDAAMEDLKEEAKGKEPEPPEPPEELKEKTTKEEPKEVPIQLMSTYHVELLNRVASIDEGIKELLKK